VDQDEVELTPEAHGSHVRNEVFAIGVDLPADRQHPGGAIRERESEMGLEVRRQTAAAGAEFEQSSRACRRRPQTLQQVHGFLRVLFGR
jgi:hypothetical protein